MYLQQRGFTPYAPYIAPLKYYCPVYKPPKFLGIYDPLLFKKPKLSEKFTKGFYHDKSDDLASKEMITESENMRPLREKDYYQDHTYHNQWLQRELEPKQKYTLMENYPYFMPNYQVTPWIWYPGDTVEVVSGEFAGQRGNIIAVIAYKNEIIVQNINVKTISLPATEDRPAQDMQREHPINVRTVTHVDPHTSELTNLRVVSVRDKDTGAVERRRISLASGAILPIPQESVTIEGDPLRDTPLQDALEETYDPEKELVTLVDRKLLAMERGFVKRLKESHEYHMNYSASNEKEMRSYQRDVVDRAEEIALEALASEEGAVSWLKEAQA